MTYIIILKNGSKLKCSQSFYETLRKEMAELYANPSLSLVRFGQGKFYDEGFIAFSDISVIMPEGWIV